MSAAIMVPPCALVLGWHEQGVLQKGRNRSGMRRIIRRRNLLTKSPPAFISMPLRVSLDIQCAAIAART